MHRFLYLFSAYREALAEAQASRQAEMHYRNLYEETQARFMATIDSALVRERDLVDRSLDIKAKAVDAAQVTAHTHDRMAEEFRDKQAERDAKTDTIRKWQAQTRVDLQEKLEKRRKTIA